MVENNIFSVITVCFNAGKTIERTIRSVADQTAFDEIEYIVVDGGSTDNTLQIIEKYQEKISVIISEPDEGIYDAMNKGFNACAGDYVCFLNADDVYFNSDTISNVREVFALSNPDFVCSNVQIIDEQGTVLRVWKSSFKCENSVIDHQIAHPGFFVQSQKLKRLGKAFDPTYKIAGDLKQQLIVIDKHHCTGHFLDEVTVKMLTGGESTQNLRALYWGWCESARAYREVIGKSSSIFMFKKIIMKLRQVRSLSWFVNLIGGK